MRDSKGLIQQPGDQSTDWHILCFAKQNANESLSVQCVPKLVGGCSFERSYFCSNRMTWVYIPPGKSVLRIVLETSNLLDMDLPAETGGSSLAEPGLLPGGAKTDLCLHLNIDRLRKRPGLCCKYKSGRLFSVCDVNATLE